MRIRRALLVLVVLLIPATAGADDHTADFFFGLSYANASHLGGLHLAFGKTINRPGDRNLAVIGDMTVHFGSHGGDDLTRYTFQGGLRWSFDATSSKAHVPSVHVLVGGVHDDSLVNDTDPSITFGGSYEFVPTGTRTSQTHRGPVFRVQGDFVASGVDKFPRLSAGFVYRW